MAAEDRNQELPQQLTPSHSQDTTAVDSFINVFVPVQGQMISVHTLCCQQGLSYLGAQMHNMIYIYHFIIDFGEDIKCGTCLITVL